jgi:hypothetical protein
MNRERENESAQAASRPPRPSLRELEVEARCDRSRLLDDRLLAIEGLVTEVRACLLDNCEEVMTGVSLTAALEAARLLARSITRDVESDPEIGHREGEARVRWTVMIPESEQPRPRPVPAMRPRKG